MRAETVPACDLFFCNQIFTLFKILLDLEVLIDFYKNFSAIKCGIIRSDKRTTFDQNQFMTYYYIRFRIDLFFGS